MRKLMMKMSMSIDGFVGGPNGEADWIFKSSDEMSRAWVVELGWTAGLIIKNRDCSSLSATNLCSVFIIATVANSWSCKLCKFIR
jgi:hypothetical protein